MGWLLLITGVALATLTVMPWIRTGRWVIRVCDFPRLQLALACALLLAVGLALWMAVGLEAPGRVALALLGVSLVIQLIYIAPFLAFWPVSVRRSGAPDGLSVLISNLDYGNDRADDAVRTLEKSDPDVLVLVEIDRRWADRLSGLR